MRMVPAGHVPQAGDEAGERRLARPGRADEGEGLPCRDRQRDVAQDEPVGRVAERHGVELDRAGDRRHRPRVRRVDDGRPRVDDLEHPLDRPGPLSELAVQPGDRPEAGRDGHAVQQEAGQRADPELALDDLVPRVPEQPGQRAEAEEPHQRPEQRPPQGQPRAGRDHRPQVRVVALELPLLADVALDHADAGQRLLGGRRAPRDRVLDLRADPLERSTEDDRDGDQGRREEQDDEQQRRAEGEQDDDRADEADDRRQQARDGLGEHRPHERHVARQARHQLPHPAAGVEVERQRHEAAEQVAAQLGHDPLPDDAEQVGLEEAADRLDAEQPEEQHDQAVEAGRVATGDDLGRDPGDDQREGQPDAPTR